MKDIYESTAPFMNRLMDKADVTQWPRWARRTFLLTLPVSVLLLLVYFVLVLMFIGGPIVMASVLQDTFRKLW